MLPEAENEKVKSRIVQKTGHPSGTIGTLLWQTRKRPDKMTAYAAMLQPDSFTIQP